MKKIMILGAGIYQVPLIRTARRMGLYTIVVSIPGDYPGFALADKIYELNTRDKEAILAAAEKEQIDGICTSGTDVAVSTIGYVCEKMHLSGIPYEAAEILTDKAKMKDAFRQGGVSAADGMRVRSAEEAQKAAEQLGYPVVVKRVDSSGSRGITVVEHSGQIEEAYENARNGSARDYVLVEKFLCGTEIGVDGFVQNHKLVFLAPHTKFVYRGAHTTVPVGHAFPYGCSGALREEIARQMQLAVTASGADQCSVNADVFVDGEKVWIIEMGGRTGATCIPELISTYYGFDFYEQMIKSALGEETDFQQTATKIVMPEDTEELALTLNGKKRKIQKSDFVKVMKASGLSDKVIENIAKKFRRSIVKWLDLIDISFLSDNMKKEYKKLILNRVLALR